MHLGRKTLYEGKAKIIFPHTDEVAVQHFKDDITAFNAQSSATLENKGILNNKISYLLMRHIAEHNIATHLMQYLNEREQLVQRLDMIPLEVIVRNVAAGSICKRYGIPSGQIFNSPLVEFYLKNDDLLDPMLTEDHIQCFELATKDEVDTIRKMALQINTILNKLFRDICISLVDLKLEFGKAHNNREEIILADEISPDTCRLWDKTTGNILDKDLYRLNLGNVTDGYNEVLQRIEEHFNKEGSIPW